MRQKTWISVTILILFLVTVIPYSVSYFSHTEVKDNTITIGENDIMINEEFEQPDNWMPDTAYKKNVKVRNTGTVPCYIRVYAVLSDMDIPASMDFNTTKWTKKDDGYWYYNDIVSPGAVTSSLITQVTIANATADQLKSFDVIIYAESIQAEGYKSINDAFSSIQ